MLRLDTTSVSDESDAWQPADQIVLQADTGAGSPVVEVLVRCDADAPWKRVLKFWPSSEPIVRLPFYPHMMLKIAKNPAGTQVRIWDSE